MILTTSREQLAPALAYVRQGCAKSAALPILACVLVEVQGVSVRLTATTLDQHVRASYAVMEPSLQKGLESGVICIDLARFFLFVTQAPKDAAITLRAGSDGWATAKYGRVSMRLPCLSAHDFPRLPDPPKAHSVILAARTLSTLLERVAHAASPKNLGRPLFEGAYVRWRADTEHFEAFATDGMRMSLTRLKDPLMQEATPDTKNPTWARLAQGMLIPLDGVAVLQACLSPKRLADDDTVTLRLDRHTLVINQGELELGVRLVEAPYLEQITAAASTKNRKATLLLDLQLARDAIGRACQHTDDLQSGLLIVDQDTPTLRLYVRTKDLREYQDAIDANVRGTFSGQLLFNIHHLHQALKSFEGGEVEIVVQGEHSPLVLLLPTGDPYNVRVVMPRSQS